MSGYKVFISYKHDKDEGAAKRIAEMIEQQTGLRCWYDEYLRGGDEYDRIIFRRIEECAYFAFVMSEDSLRSSYCYAELKHAIHHGKGLVPVNLDNALLQDCIRSDIEINPTAQIRLQKVQWIQYGSTDLERDIRKAFRVDHAPNTQPEPPADPAKYDQPEPADAPKEESTGTRRHGLPVPGRYLAAGAVVLACAVIAGWWLHRNGGETAGTNATESVSAEAAATKATTEDAYADIEERVYPAGYELADLGLYHVSLYADDDVTVTDFNAAVEALRGRLDVLTDGEDYTLDVVDETGVELYLPRSVFNATDDDTVKMVLLSMVTRCLDLAIIDNTTYTYTTMTDYIPVSRSDIAEVSLENGRIPDLDVSELGYGDEDYPYIRVQLTDALAQDNAETIASYGTNLRFLYDPLWSTNYYLNTIPAGDGRTFYLMESKEDSRYTELHYYNLTHEPMPFSFNYTLDLNNNAEWEQVEAATVVGGNQRNVEQLEGDLVVWSLQWFKSDPSAGDWLDEWTGLKARLDCLEQPYAIAIIEGENPRILVETGLSRMSRSVTKILVGDYAMNFRIGMYKVRTNRSYHDFTYERQEDGTWCGVLALADGTFYPDWTMGELQQRMEETGQPLIVTIDDGYPLMIASSADAIDGTTIRLDRLCYGGDSITTDQVWLLHLISAVIDGADMDQLFIQDGQYQRRSDGTLPSADTVEYSTAEYRNEIYEAVHGVADDATVLSDESTLLIELHLDVNERLPERAAALIQEIYQAVDYENSYYNDMQIYLIDEDNETWERARIFYTKSYRMVSLDLSRPGVVKGTGAFKRGRLEDYKEAFRSIVENDPFYNEVVNGEPCVTWDYGDVSE